MLKKISISILLLPLLCVNALFAQDEVKIPAGDTTIIYSRLSSLNAYANGAGVEILSEAEYSTKTRLRLWGFLSHSLAARFLDISIESDQIVGKWYAAWVNSYRQKNENEDYEKWNCISEILTVTNNFGSRSGCLIAEAEKDEVEHIRKLVFDSDFIELLRQPIEKRIQIDGNSLLLEILDQEGYEFVSFMSHHIDNHPKKELIKKARTILALWRSSSTQ